MLEAPEIQIPPYYGHTAVVPMVSALEGLYCTPHCFEVLCGLLNYGERKYPQTSLQFSWYWTHWENSISGVDKTTVNIHCTCNNNFTCDCVPWSLTSDLPEATMRSWTFHWRCRRLWGTFIAECSWSSCACPHTKSPLWVPRLFVQGQWVGVYKYHLTT